uniref:hypothetical protein n=1 Tax=Eubacterium cellulosolvens TaxID=29322 RepID=UPI00048A3EFD|nr:hypothetical protein [[Eubacterium] cellulosolvens]
MDKNRILVDLGRICETLLESDLKTSVQMRFTAVLDHEIDGELLCRAWDRTKKVYSLVDAVPGYEHEEAGPLDPEKVRKYGTDHLYLLKAESGANDPVRSKEPVRPYTDAVGRRIICVSFHEKTVCISSWHILVDGGGLNMIFRTLLYIYLTLYTEQEDTITTVELTEGRKPEDYYQADLLGHVFSQEYTPVPLYSLPRGCRGFFDEDMYNDDNIYNGSLRIDKDDLISVCKQNGVNPSSLLCALSAKAAYNLNPDRREDVVVSLTVSLKPALGLDGCISNAVRNALSYVTFEDLKKGTAFDAAKRIRKEVDSQRSKDYIVTLCRFFDTYQFVPAVRPRLVSYLGDFDLGMHTCHITDYVIDTTGHYVVYLQQVGDQFLFLVQYGRATGRYLEEFRRLFEELGIRTEVARPAHAISKGTDHAVM